MFLFFQILGLICMAIYSIYTLVVYFHSRKPRNLVNASHTEPLTKNYVFLVPGINEGQVIGNTIRNLLSLDPNTKVVFIDDASTDNSAEIVDTIKKDEPKRVFRLRREKPNAQKGKGAALNWAVRQFSRLQIVDDNSLIVIFDADGRADHNLLIEADKAFSNEKVLAAQARIRMRLEGYNSLIEKLLLMNQDLEFHIIRGVQLLRQRFYCVGMGGNGQFFRWTYISSVIQKGEEVWPDCLLEDFASGLKVLLDEPKSKMVFLESEVSQQGVYSPKKFIKQRTRWALGGYQNINQFGKIWEKPYLSKGAKFDLSYFIVQMPFNSILILSSMLATVFFIMNFISGLIPLWIIPLSMLSGLILPLIWSLSYVKENPSHKRNLGFLIISMPMYFTLMIFSTISAWKKLIARDFSWHKTARIDETIGQQQQT